MITVPYNISDNLFKLRNLTDTPDLGGNYSIYGPCSYFTKYRVLFFNQIHLF